MARRTQRQKRRAAGRGWWWASSSTARAGCAPGRRLNSPRWRAASTTWRTCSSPGEPFEVPAFFVGVYRGDWDEAGFVTQRFAEAYVHPPMPDDRYPWVQYNSWKYGQEIDEAQQLAVLERCAELGIEVAILDLGWARTIGDWRPNPAKFPRGCAPSPTAPTNWA
jgi:hypothetical protein